MGTLLVPGSLLASVRVGCRHEGRVEGWGLGPGEGGLGIESVLGRALDHSTSLGPRDRPSARDPSPRFDGGWV